VFHCDVPFGFKVYLGVISVGYNGYRGSSTDIYLLGFDYAHL